MTGSTFRLLCAATCVTAGIALSACSAQKPTAQDRSDGSQSPSALAAPASDFTLTIYSTADPAEFNPQEELQKQLSGSFNSMNGAYYSPPFAFVPGYGIVREVRRMKLESGSNRLEFSDVAAGIDPTTVAFRSLTAPDTTAVLEQNFEFDLASPEKLLQRYLGHEVVLTTKRGGGALAEPIRGKLLSATGNAYIVQTADPLTPIVIQRIDNIDSIRLAEMKTGFVTRPTLNWRVTAEKSGEQDIQVNYRTEGLTWRADYNVVMSHDEKAGDLSAWVTALNNSGLSYPNAKLKLVAGNVHRFIPADRQAGSGLFGEKPKEDVGFRESSLFEYHMYTLGRRTTLANNSTKQIELFSPKIGIPLTKMYVYYGTSGNARHVDYSEPRTEPKDGTEVNNTVDVYLGFRNGVAEHLGLPLPAGRVRVFKIDPADGNREFVGEDVIDHTPRDENVLVRLGGAFDLFGERTQTDFKQVDKKIEETFEIKLRNHKSEPVHIIVKESLYRWFNWEIVQSSEAFQKQDYRTIQIPVDIPPGGERKLTYTVRYTW